MSDSGTDNLYKRWSPWQMQDLPPAVRRTIDVRDTRPDLAPATREQAAAPADTALDEAFREARDKGHAEGYQAGREQGQAEGYKEGLAQGRQQAESVLQAELEQTLAPLRTLADSSAEACRQFDEQITGAIVELALAVGQQLAGEALDATPRQVLTLVRKLLQSEQLPGDQPCLWLHPEDLILVQQHLQQDTDSAGWSLQADESLRRGDCRLTGASGEIDATWEQRWQNLIRQVRRPRRQRRTQQEQA